MASNIQAVEKLKQENKSLRLELQQIKVQGVSDAFRQIGFDPNASQDQGHLTQQLAIQSEHHSTIDDSIRKSPRPAGGFFMTETDNFNERDRSPDNQQPQQYSPKKSIMPQ
jgi:hypothetical protein